MKREIGKWFLDIAKYIVTAVVLKELFGGFDEKSIVVTVATLTALFAFFSGIIILKSADNKDKRKVILMPSEDHPQQAPNIKKGRKK